MIDLQTLRLDKESAIPLYEQLRLHLLQLISDGRLTAGQQLPTEEEFCRSLGISRPVVQAACAALIRDGIIRRIRGKGTFISIPDSRGRFINQQLSFARQMEILGLPHRTEVMGSEWVSCPAALSGLPGVSDQFRWFHLQRLRYVSGSPFVLVENMVPESLLPGIDQYDFSRRSLYDVLQQVYGLRVVRARRTLKASAATPLQAQCLGIHAGDPVMFVQNIAYDQQSRIIDLSYEYLDGETQRFEFDVYNR